MIMLILALLLSLSAPAAAQSTLQLPDVTLLGEYTLLLTAPSPADQDVPQATGMSDSRLSYPRYLFKIDLAVPRPPLVYWQRIPRSALAPPGLLPDSRSGEADRNGGDGQTAESSGWQAGLDYIPTETVISEFSAARSSGLWDLAALLHFDLADGWITSPPDFPTDLTFAVQSRRRAQIVDFDAVVGIGAFYSADAAAVYTLGLSAGTHGTRTIVVNCARSATGVATNVTMPSANPAIVVSSAIQRANARGKTSSRTAPPKVR